MVDFFQDLTGSAGDYSGSVGGFDTSSFSLPPSTTTFDPSYTGTSFDYSNLFPTYQADLPSIGASEANLPSFTSSPYGGFNLPVGLPQTPTPAAPTTAAPTPAPEPAATGGVLGSILGGKDLTTADMTKLLLGAGTGVLGYFGQQRAQQQAAQAQKKIQEAYQKAAQDYQASVAAQRTPASTALSEALQGRFSDEGLRAFRAAEARLAQGAERAGGVGAAQATEALEKTRQQILANQIKMAQEILTGTNPAIQSAVQAELSGQITPIEFGLNMQNQINQASASLYAQILRMLT